MKKIFLLIFAVSAILFAGCNEADDNETTEKEQIYTTSTKNLILFYADGDNNLETAIYNNLLYAAKGYKSTHNEDNTTKTGYKDFKVVALWDGAYNELADTALLEFKYPKDTDTLDYTQFSRNISSKADFLSDKNELDMADYTTLENFLYWAKNYYKNVEHTYLIILDHGFDAGGTYAESRSVCQDQTTDDHNKLNPDLKTDTEKLYGYKFITTNQLAEAINNAGYNNTNLDMIFFDTCFTASIEDIYELRNSSKTIIASPNEIPGDGNDYEKFLKQFTEAATLEDIGNEAVNTYAEKYYNYKNRGSSYNASLSFFDLTYADITEEINDLSNYLLNNYTYLPFSYSTENTLFYKATYSYLSDINYLLRKLQNMDNSIELEMICDQLRAKLSNLIIKSWHENYSADYTIEGEYPNLQDSDCYGITIIMKKTLPKNTNPVEIYKKTEFAFNSDTDWGLVLSKLIN